MLWLKPTWNNTNQGLRVLELIHVTGYDLDVEDNSNSINRKARNLISRNAPLAVVVGAAGFLGSHVVDELLKKNIQVVGIDDFSTGERINLTIATRDSRFHLLNTSIDSERFLNEIKSLDLKQLDYAFFIAESNSPEVLYTKGLHYFLEFVTSFKKQPDEDEKSRRQTNKTSEKLAVEKPKIAFVSSIELYNNKLNHNQALLKTGEVRFAKYIKHYNLNGRIIRLSALFGPRMHFRSHDPIIRLIQAALLKQLQEEQSSLDFTSRALFVADAVTLILKSVLSGSTSHKIFDGALDTPVKVSEIKQLLLDPLWYEQKGFSPSELPPWLTPNLARTIKELSWKPKTNLITALKHTIAYFKDTNVSIPGISEKTPIIVDPELAKKWTFKTEGTKDSTESESSSESQEKENPEEIRPAKNRRWGIQSKIGFLLIAGIIFYGLLYPIVSLAMGGLNIRNNLKSSRVALEEGNFQKASEDIKRAKGSVADTKELLSSLSVLKRLGVFATQITDLETVLNAVGEGIDAADHATVGSNALFQATKIISGEDKSDPKEYYRKAQIELTSSSQKISKVAAILQRDEFKKKFPEFVQIRLEDLSQKLALYGQLVEKARSASFLLPEITAVDGKKNYLILLMNNLELRPTGGFIGSYGKLTFEGGRLTTIAVDDIYNLDGGLKELIEPPAELKSDMGLQRWFLRDSNFDPDFPTSARQAEFFYKRIKGETINGVIAMDLSASGKLLSAVGGLDLPEYGEHVDGSNLFEKAISHAEVNFFPGSQAKKNYLVSLQTQLFNKVFYLSKQNWPAIIQASGESLEQKHLMVYLADPTLFSYIASSNWGGVFPRGAKSVDGETSDFLAVVESNMGANKSNFYLTRSFRLDSSFSKEGLVIHKLNINYKNASPSEVFPAGKYKNRLRVYVPLGTKMQKVVFGETDITQSVTTFNDHGRAGFSMLIELNPKEQKPLIFEYSLPVPLNFKDKKSQYRLDIIKQPGTDKDSFEWNLTYPINFSVEGQTSDSNAEYNNQEVTISTDLQKDRSFLFTVSQK